ncbi:MAG: hypothetical protein IPK08_20070 [Bacteroidetes bacterium]|nr:hypothetical protein [Bacteroidota bacterium]
MHDLEKPGWYFLIPVCRFILSTLSGNPRRNKYGQDPKLEDFMRERLTTTFSLKV